jgi:heterotetrameric sarcosine oxidase gamma subunit
MLTTHSDLPYSSPLADGPIGPETARLADASGRLLLDVRGRERPAALRGQTAPETVGEVVRVDDGFWVRLRADRWVYVSDAAGDVAEPSGERAVTDVTHAYGILSLSGTRAAEVLAQVGALDFSDRAFPDHHAAQTSLAKVAALIVRLDEAGHDYLILVERSVAVYVWAVMADILPSVVAVALGPD